MRRDLVAKGVRIGFSVCDTLQVNSAVELVALAGLDEEELRLARQGRAAFGVKMSPGIEEENK